MRKFTKLYPALLEGNQLIGVDRLTVTPAVTKLACLSVVFLLLCSCEEQCKPLCYTSNECHQTLFFQVGSSNDTTSSMDAYAFQ